MKILDVTQDSNMLLSPRGITPKKLNFKLNLDNPIKEFILPTTEQEQEVETVPVKEEVKKETIEVIPHPSKMF